MPCITHEDYQLLASKADNLKASLELKEKRVTVLTRQLEKKDSIIEELEFLLSGVQQRPWTYNPHPFPFLKLPSEVRNRIYYLLLVFPSGPIRVKAIPSKRVRRAQVWS